MASGAIGARAMACALLCACSSGGSMDGMSASGGMGGSAATAGSMPTAGQGAIGGDGASGSAAMSASGGIGGAGTSGGASGTGNTGGSAGSGGMMDAGGTDASTDAGTDSGTAMPLAARVCPAGMSFGAPLPTEVSERAATLVQAGFTFIEGQVWVAEQGFLLFTDMDFTAPASPTGPPARIRRLTPPSSFDVWLEGANSNGLALDNAGDVIACSHDVQSLSRFDIDSKARTPLALLYMGDHFNSPNDLTVRSDGTVYFTDPDWQLGTRSSETGITGVFRVTPAGNVELVDDSLNKPNGVALSPDESTLYVGSAGNDIRRYAIHPDGSVEPSDVFASPGGADGFAIDCAGNLYVATGSVIRVFAPNADPLGEITLSPAGATPSNVAFGGDDRKTLYITAGTGVYSIDLLVPGLPY